MLLCQGFVEKVGEIRFNKVKQRQVNKFNNLLKKEGNITGVSTQFSSSQAGTQASSHPPGAVLLPRQSVHPLGRFSGFPGRQAGTHLPSQEGSSLAASQAGSQAGSHLPGDSTSSQASSAVPPNSIPEGKVLPRKVITPQLLQ